MILKSIMLYSGRMIRLLTTPFPPVPSTSFSVSNPYSLNQDPDQGILLNPDPINLFAEYFIVNATLFLSPYKLMFEILSPNLC